MASDRFGPLLKGARRGEEAAWAEIYRQVAPPVLGYLRANGAPDPEDVLGETFFQVARDLARFDGDERGFRSWVFTIASHRMIDARRGAARRPVDPVEEVPEDDTEVVSDTADVVLEQLGADEVRQVLDTLSPDQRSVLLLRILGDMTVPECAKALGKRPGAIKALQRRGLAAIRRQLREGGGVTL